MEVYFVRHGETAANAHHRHQPDSESLNDLGRKQAHVVAARLRAFSPNRIISSPFTRAFETAKILGEELSLPVTTHESFVELKRPPYVYGYRHYGLRSLWYMVNWFLKYSDPDWREVGAESYEMFVDRITEAREYLETLPDDSRVVVVSHSVFINFFVQHVCNKKRMSLAEAFLRLLKIVVLDNSSITHLEYHSSQQAQLCTWMLLQFDDDAHVVT